MSPVPIQCESLFHKDARGSCYCDVSADETLISKDIAFDEPTAFTRLFILVGYKAELSMASCDFLGLIRFNQGSELLPSPLQFPACCGESVTLKVSRNFPRSQNKMHNCTVLLNNCYF